MQDSSLRIRLRSFLFHTVSLSGLLSLLEACEYPFPGDNYIDARCRGSAAELVDVPGFEVQHTLFQYTLDR